MNLIAAITGIGFALNPFISAPAESHASAAEAGGVWVTLCATGGQIWLDFGGTNTPPDGPPPPSTPHAKACHAVCCTRSDGLESDTDLSDGSDKA